MPAMHKADAATVSPHPVRPPQFFEFSGELVAAQATGALSPGWRLSGEHSWAYRAQNFVVVVSWVGAGQVLEEEGVADESILLVMDGTSVDVSADGSAPETVAEPAVVVVPATGLRITCHTAGYIVRVYSTRDARTAERALNAAAYATANPALIGLPDTAPPAGETLRVHRLSQVPAVAGRFGRIFRTSSLMVNWFEPQIGPRDTDQLSPHSHDDFEQGSVTMAGEYVHHIRRPWTPRLREWRPDEHVHVHSPSVTIIPPGNIHTTRAIGDGVHHLIDVFAPPRADFIENGWVINQPDYAVNERNVS
jgi:mannose-6-phosphate isomerase-like protein (cupin superfamily)